MTVIEQLSKFPELANFRFSEIESSLEGIDSDAVAEIQRKRFSWKIWDGSEPINGQTLEQMKDFGMKFSKDGNCFLVRDKQAGAYVHFQTFDPRTRGFTPMSSEVAEKLAAQLCEKLAREETLRALADHIMNKVDKK